MALAVELDAELKRALLDGDKNAVNALRGLKAAILDVEVAAGARTEGLADAEIQKIIAKEVKKRKESVEIYRANGRDELAATETAEIEVLAKFLPAQMSEAELRAVIKDVTSEMGEVSAREMGKVIGLVKAKVGNAADGALVARLVKDSLQ
jgi:uncharacterized protein YqeY